MGILENFANTVTKSPMGIMNLIGMRNPRMQNVINQIQTITNGDVNKAKELVIEKMQGMNKEQFNQLSQTAKNFGVDDNTISEISKYIK